MSAGQALIGTYDKERDKFIAQSHIKANHGVLHEGGMHAPSATPDGDGNIIVIHNVNAGKKTGVMRSTMTLPRRLTLDGDDIKTEPAGNYQSLRHNHRHIGRTILNADEKSSWDGVSGNSIEMIIKLDVTDSDMIEFNVLESGTEVTKIRYYHRRGHNEAYRRKDIDRVNSLLEVDPTHSSTASDILTRPVESMEVYIADNKPELHIFIDKSIMEVFLNGRDCACIRIYPENPDSTGISIMSKGRPAILESLEIWDMRKLDYSI
jgi:beta-fructofuranosidase